MQEVLQILEKTLSNMHNIKRIEDRMNWNMGLMSLMWIFIGHIIYLFILIELIEA